MTTSPPITDKDQIRGRHDGCSRQGAGNAPALQWMPKGVADHHDQRGDRERPDQLSAGVEPGKRRHRRTNSDEDSACRTQTGRPGLDRHELNLPTQLRLER